MKVKILCDLLLPLKDSTVLLSSSNTPTSHHIFTEMFDLLIHIETCIGQAMDVKDHDDDDREVGESIHEACTNMMTEWNKYFSTAGHLNVVAHIMDLRFKLRFLADMFKEGGHMIEETFKSMIRNMYQRGHSDSSSSTCSKEKHFKSISRSTYNHS